MVRVAAHRQPHCELGTGSNRNTAWSVNVIGGAEEAGDEGVLELHVHADLVVGLRADLLVRGGPAAAARLDEGLASPGCR